MKNILTLLLVAGLMLTGCATSQSTYSSRDDDNVRTEESVTSSKLNNRRLEKNLAKFSHELNFSKRQLKDLKKIDKKYARKERRLSRRDQTKKRDLRQLASEKREEILYILTQEQQQKLEALVKKGRFSFDSWFGK